MNRKSITIICFLVILTTFLCLFYLYRTEVQVPNVKKRSTVLLGTDTETQRIKAKSNDVTVKANSKNEESKRAKQKLENYKKYCKTIKSEFFSSEEDFMDLLYKENKDYRYIEDQIDFFAIFAHELMHKKPSGENICLLDTLYKRIAAMLDAYDSKKLDDEQRIEFAKPLLQVAIAFSPSSYITSLAIVRELIDHKLISSRYLYECRDYMNKLKEIEKSYTSRKVTEVFYKNEKRKLGDDISFLLLTIERSLQ